MLAVAGSAIFGGLAIAGSVGCGFSLDSAACTRMLFIGNSYTYVNDLPNTFANLSRSGGHKISVGMAATAGWTLAQHAASDQTANKLASERWSYVVLQEQSEIPSLPSLRETQMYPAADQLVASIRSRGAQPLFFLTWAHRDGWRENGLPDYQSMQSAIDEAYAMIARDEQVSVVPVGVAWSAALRVTNLDLWQSDGSHPTVAGTYLAACVFYHAIYDQSPVGLSYRDGLSANDAETLQQIAAQVGNIK